MGRRITIEDIHEKTDGGLNVILSLFPDAYESVANPNKKFKMRGEKTPSAKLNRIKDGTYRVVDFGTSHDSLNCVQLYMQETGADFGRAIQEIARQFNVSPKNQVVVEAKVNSKPANVDQKEGEWTFQIRDHWTDAEIEYLIPKFVLIELGWTSKVKEEKDNAYAKIASTFKEYNWHPLSSRTMVKNRNVITFEATADYPMFLWDEGQLKKVYEPKNKDKNYRFMYAPGSKVGHFIHGLSQLQKAHEKRVIESQKAKNANSEDEDRGNGAAKGDVIEEKFEVVLLCAGGSDAIAAALLGYRVLWGTSETFKLQGWQYGDIMKCTEKLAQVMDLDATGLNVAHQRNLEFINLHTVELPKSLLDLHDSRGYVCKDLRDYLNYFKAYDFRQLVKNSIPYRFWDEKQTYTRDGKRKGVDYDFNNVHAYNFLQKNGFYRMPVGDKESDFEYIHIDGSTVKKSNPIRIKHFIKRFLEERNMEVPLRNAIFRTTQLSDSSLTNLDEIELDFEDYTPYSQLMFFQNTIVEVTAKGIEEIRHGDRNRFVWEKDIHNHRFVPLKEKPYIITQDELGNYDIEIKSYDCLYLKFLIQTSRIHWRTELETRLDEDTTMTPEQKEQYRIDNQFNIAGPLLTAEEIEEQKSHLINKLFAMGYLMHRYKNRSKAWMVVGMDAKRSTDGQAHGGSGKSIFFDVAMTTLLKNSFMLAGKNTKLDTNDHKYDGLTEYHRYIFVEDAHQYLNYDFLYTDVTGDINVNPKGKQPYTIPFRKAPKISLTTNYAIRNLTPSTERRILYTAFSDYYHTKGETTDYREQRDPGTEFGKQLFEQFNEVEYNSFYNTAAHALSFYLGANRKVTPAMDNVNVRNLMDSIGASMLDWAETYFDEEGENVNKLIIREVAYKDFLFNNPRTKMTAHSWKTRLEAFCRLNGFIFNPTRLLGKRGNIIKKTEAKVYEAKYNVWTSTGGSTVAMEHLFIQTPDFEVPENVQPKEYRQGDMDLKNEDDPF